MCLAIPGKITDIKDDRLATVDIMGVTREISLDLCPQAVLGDYVLVHAGFAIQIVSEDFAQETIDLINQFPELIADDLCLIDETASDQSNANPLAGISSLADEDFVSTGASSEE